jgi:CBS domain-containing protein
MNANDIMTRTVISIGIDRPLAEAVRLMVSHRIGGLPVLDKDGRLAGMLTEGDLLRRVEVETDKADSTWFDAFFTNTRLASHYIRTHARHVDQMMTRDVISVEESTPLGKVVMLMQRHRVKRLPVACNGRLVGIVSRFDLLRVVSDRLNAPRGKADDAEIETAVRDAINAQPWAPSATTKVAVTDGMVRLEGHTFEMAVRDAMTVLVESVPGVTRVENQLVCIDPTTGLVCWDPGDKVAAEISR